MQTSGTLKYVEKTWATLKFYWSEAHKVIKESSPEYYKAVVDFCTPYIKLANDFYLILRSISIRLLNNAAAYVEKYTPIVLETVSILKISNTFTRTTFI